ncbi:MAG: hypothetical protein WEA56_12005 [Balneolaceae bacterium]
MLKSSWYLLFLLIPTGVYGQSHSQSINIRVSATVQETIELITIESLDLRNANRQESILTLNPVQDSGAGKMVARGTPGSEFRLDYLRQRELTNTRGTGTLLVIYNISGNHIDEQQTSELLEQEVRDLEFNDDGEFYIWIGGIVDLSEAEPGSYEGDFTIEIEYI